MQYFIDSIFIENSESSFITIHPLKMTIRLQSIFFKNILLHFCGIINLKNIKIMKLVTSIVVMAVLFITNSVIAQEKASITAEVINVSSDTGKVGFALYDKASFMLKPIQAVNAKIAEGKSIVTFENVPFGEYAIICYHDKNDNDKMDFSANGMPIEDYGASNNVMTFGPPTFEGAKFAVSEKNVSLKIKF